MRTYQLESTVQGNGTILLTYLNHLRNCRVKLIVIDFEEGDENPADRLRTSHSNIAAWMKQILKSQRHGCYLLGAVGQASSSKLDYKNDIYEELFSEFK